MSRLVVLLPFAFVACVDSGDEGMYVVNNTAISGTTCTLSGAPDQPFLSHGQIWNQSPLAYQLTPLIQSRIQSVDNVDDISKTIQLRSADVRLTVKAITNGTSTTQSNVALPPFSALFAGPLTPGGTVNVGFDLIPEGHLASIRGMGGSAEVLAEIVVKGDMSGDEVTSQPYFYPVSVCADCVVRNVGACPMLGTPRTGNPCNPYQDGIVDCCDAGGGNLICPATSM